MGEEIVEHFTRKGLKFLIEKTPYPTGTVQVDVDADGQPTYNIREQVAWDNIPYTDGLNELARRTQAFCFGSLAQRSAVSRATIRRFIDALPAENDSWVIFDVNLRQHFYGKEILNDSITRCNTLKLNDIELNIISRMFDIPDGSQTEQCRWLLERFHLKIVILTCGISGSYICTSNQTLFQATPIVQVADTVGAGDSFTAAFIASLIKGKSIAEAHLCAVQVSAYVCTQKGAMPILSAAQCRSL